jgi:hypothetical protein
LEERNLHKLMKKKNRSTTLGLSHHGGEELELAGDWYSEWLGWQEEEGGTMFIWLPPLVSARNTTQD